MLTIKQITIFQQEILAWYKKNKRDLPWRKDRDPYHILVSEMMLQQTQVQRVLPKYVAWIQAFPDVVSLAKASTRDVLFHWSGLGYNRRALYLQKCAEELVKISSLRAKRSNLKRSPRSLRSLATTDNIFWPQTEKELKTLSGIGEYTARALLCFAFDKQVAVIDTNIRKVILIHFKEFTINLSRKEEMKMVEQIAQALLPQDRAYDWNQALMDYASEELKKEKISIPKQSKFKDSDRFYRGQIIKYLLLNKQVKQHVLQQFFAEKISGERFENIVKSLVKDKLIQKKGKIVLLSD